MLVLRGIFFLVMALGVQSLRCAASGEFVEICEKSEHSKKGVQRTLCEQFVEAVNNYKQYRDMAFYGISIMYE